MTRLRFLVAPSDQRRGPGAEADELLSVSIHRGVVPRNIETDDLPRAEDLANYKVVRTGDVVLNRMRAFQGAVGRADHDGIVSPDYTVLHAGPDVEPRYLHHLFRSLWFVGEMVARLRGIGSTDTGSVRTPRINWEDLGDIDVSAPSLADQRAIADYLDAEAARIDALITKKQQLIHLLEEQMAVYLDEVVWSSAFSRTPLMRIVQPGRRIMYGIVLPGPDVPDGVLLVKGGNVKPGLLRPDRLARTSRDIEASYARSRLQGGDLVFAIRGGVGDVEMVPAEISGANITQDVARVAPSPGVNGRYLLHALRAPTTQSDVQERITGATIRGINIWELERVTVPLPSAAEQDRIADLLDRADQRHRRRLELLRRQIDLLGEHRQALITAAVTGETGVRTHRPARATTISRIGMVVDGGDTRFQS